MDNYDDVLAQLRAYGLEVDTLEVGRLRRCRVEGRGRERPGWYALHEIRLDNGREVLVGSYGIWRGNEDNRQRIELGKADFSAEQRAAVRQRMAEDRKKAQAQRKAEAERAARRAEKAWRACATEGDHDYLHKKGVRAHGLRFSPRGALVIPVLDVAGRMQGLQVIRAASSDKKFWPAGLSVAGGMHTLGLPQNGGIILVAEGYATAASLHEATGLPVACAFNANNLQPVAAALRKRYKQARLLICADDDTTQRCRHCRGRVWLNDAGAECPHCGKEHEAKNAGITSASTAALAVDGQWIAPAFSDEHGRRTAWLEKGRKDNDFNDLHAAEGLHVVRAQVDARLLALGWREKPRAAPSSTQGGRGGDKAPLRPIESLDELVERFSLVFGKGGMVFDHQEHMLMQMSDVRDACMGRELFREWQDSPERAIVRPDEVGFDPTERDENIICNLWGGWPTAPKKGDCQHLLDLLMYLCGSESQDGQLYAWVLRWLAYPLQHPGAKMKTTLVLHGPQGTGKNLFFEAYMAIYGPYGRIIDQSALEDKFNDWASKKLFLIADEVVARSDLYHVKNKLKAFITGEWIRINPKNIQAYDEKNHVNMVFLSNESMPVVIEEDDRRHCVIWTPEKLPADFYACVRKEIENGGVAALHDYLLQVDLGDFDPGANPPMTAAKRELIHLSEDSPSAFFREYSGGYIEGFPGASTGQMFSPALSADFYDLYVHFCRTVNLRALNQARFTNALVRKHKARIVRKRYVDMTGQTKGPLAVIELPGGQEMPPARTETEWYSERIMAFKSALADYKKRGIAQ